MRGVVSGISTGSTELASAVSEQASAIQETASSIEEMNAMVKKNTDSASRSRDAASTCQNAATRGKEAVTKMIYAIDEINTSNDKIMKQVDESNRQIQEIVKVITEIGNKTKVINDIVFQTKLLSFNASVEAARAGEHGKGFAVVAEEVGNLAQMSGNASKEIADMLSASIGKVDTIVSETKSRVERLINEGRQKVESGTVVAKDCGLILEDVVKNVSEVSHMINEITTATQEQSQGINEITRAMNQLDQVTHANASASQQSATAAVKLSNQADSVINAVGELRVIIGGSSVQSAGLGKNVAAEISSLNAEPYPQSVTNEKIVKFEKPSVGNKTQETKVGAVKLAASGDFVPSENDPRFKDL